MIAAPAAVARTTRSVALAKDEAEERVILADERADSQERAQARHLDVHDLKEARAERLARTFYHNEDDEIARCLPRVVELVLEGQLEHAEVAVVPQTIEGMNLTALTNRDQVAPACPPFACPASNASPEKFCLSRPRLWSIVGVPPSSAQKNRARASARCGSRFRPDAASRRKCGVCADPAHQLHGLTLVTIPYLREICAASELLYWAARKRIAPRKSTRSLRALVLRRARWAGRDRILWRTIRPRNSLSADPFLGLGDFPQHAGWGNRAGAFRKGACPLSFRQPPP
jgi:hypothetical protein